MCSEESRNWDLVSGWGFHYPIPRDESLRFLLNSRDTTPSATAQASFIPVKSGINPGAEGSRPGAAGARWELQVRFGMSRRSFRGLSPGTRCRLIPGWRRDSRWEHSKSETRTGTGTGRFLSQFGESDPKMRSGCDGWQCLVLSLSVPSPQRCPQWLSLTVPVPSQCPSR